MEGRRAKGLERQRGMKGGLWGSPGFLSLQTDTPEKELRARTGLELCPCSRGKIVSTHFWGRYSTFISLMGS